MLTVGTTARFAREAADLAAAEGISVAHYDLRYAKPLDEKLLDEVAERFDKVITVEDGSVRGGVGEAVAAYFQRGGKPVRVRSLGIPDRFIEHGTPAELYRLCGYDTEGVLDAIRTIIR